MESAHTVSAVPTTASSTGPANGGRQARAGFAGRGRNRGQGGRGRGGDRAGRGTGRNQHQGQNTIAQTTQQQPDAPAMDTPQPTLPVQPTMESTVAPAPGDDVEAEVCFICASPVIHNSVAPCNHRTCHICALRLRALYKTKACAHCRTESPFVIFTDDGEKRFEDFQDTDFAEIDENLGIKYEKKDIAEDTRLLLRYNCPDPDCDAACWSWPDLHRHVKSVHHKVMCDLCTRHKKVFTHEHELFTQRSLAKHERYGDDHPGAIDQSGFRGHPECGFCKLRFYDGDELYAHCRDHHERCHICDRNRAYGQQQQYFRDYNSLEEHFGKDHFLCQDKECLEKKFVVFGSEMDLKAHQLEQHPHGLSKDARRDARRVDMSGFDYRQSQQDDRRVGRRDGREPRGRGRGRDPNAEPLPISSAQPLRRDELAYQRQLAIHSAQSISQRSFGGQLTPLPSQPARPNPPAASGAPPLPIPTISRPGAPANGNLPDIASLDISSTPLPSVPATPEDRARALRHSSVTERASNLLGHSAEKMATFRNRVSEYRRSVISPTDLIDSFFALFDCPASELSTLIKELADLFELPSKRDALLKAWNDWRAINEDYPSLPGGPAGSVANASASGKRILKLKSSTAQSSQSAQRSWGNLASGVGRSAGRPPAANAFPTLPSSSSVKPKLPTSGWNSSAASSTSHSPAPTSRTIPGKGPSLGVDAFPSLPAAQKPGMNISRPGFAGTPYRRDGSGTSTPVNAWSAFGGGSGWGNGGGGTAGGEGAVGVDAQTDGGKGKGRKKQTLIHWG